MQAPSLKNKSKRVQKKLFLGDYAIYGFEVSAKFNSEKESDSEAFFNSFVELIEAKNFYFVGGYTTEEFDGFITALDLHQSNTEEDRQYVNEWLKAQTILANFEVGSLVDANYAS
ncbi:MAG: 50S ribosome-binding protein YggL [Pseudomonadota bacterium]